MAPHHARHGAQSDPTPTSFEGGWRGTVGLVKPTYRPGSLEETIRHLPPEVGVIPMHAGIERGTTEEFEAIRTAIEARVADLADLPWTDAVYVEGVPPAMVLGNGGDQRFADRLSEEHGLPVSLATLALVDALRALEVESLVGLTYATEAQNDTLSAYLEDAGVDVLAMEGVDTPFGNAGRVPAPQVYEEATALHRESPAAEGVYLYGGAWRVLGIVDRLEADLDVPVVTGIQTSIWHILDLLQVGESPAGYGQLLAEHV